MELVEQRDLEINEKNATIKSYLDKIVRSDSALYSTSTCICFLLFLRLCCSIC